MSTTPMSGASPVDTTVGGTKIGGAQTLRKGMLIQNLGAADLYIGGQGVTVDTGIKIPAGDSLPLGDFTGQLYGIAAAGSVDVRWLGVS